MIENIFGKERLLGIKRLLHDPERRKRIRIKRLKRKRDGPRPAPRKEKK